MTERKRVQPGPSPVVLPVTPYEHDLPTNSNTEPEVENKRMRYAADSPNFSEEDEDMGFTDSEGWTTPSWRSVTLDVDSPAQDEDEMDINSTSETFTEDDEEEDIMNDSWRREQDTTLLNSVVSSEMIPDVAANIPNDPSEKEYESTDDEISSFGEAHRFDLQQTGNTPQIILSKTNSPITGLYSASQAITLRTSNAPIAADITLGPAFSFSDPQIVLRTSNASIRGTATFLGSEHVTFIAKLRTSNAPIDWSLLNLPSSESRLVLYIRASNAPVTVRLPCMFAGTITAATSSGTVQLSVPPRMRDPEDIGREYRQQEVEKAPGRIVQRVWWHVQGSRGFEDSAGGEVEVRSSNASVRVEIAQSQSV